jgi:TP901 family phage tail tape measure protein
MASMDDIRVGLKVTVDEAQKQAVGQTEKMVAGLGAKVASMSTAATAGIGVVLAGVAGTAAAMIATVGAASKFEDSFAGIKKTVNATDVEFEKLAGNIRKMAVDIPVATSQLNAIGEIGGQLGISAAGLARFIDTIAKLGVATRLSTESAALGLARLREIFQLSENDFDNLASTLVDLGNNFAALEDEILNTALRLAAGGKIAGATAQDVLGIATALQAVGVQSQAGGTAVSRVFQQIRVAATTGGSALETFNKVAGDGFAELAETDAASAFNLFLQGLQDISNQGGNVIQVLEDLGLKQQRTIRALLSLAEAGDLVTESLVVANTAYAANIALNDEANKRFETFKSQTKLLGNAFQELRIEMGTAFLPIAKSMVTTLTTLFKAMDSNSDSVKGLTSTLVGFVAVIGAVGGIIGKALPGLMLFRNVQKLTGVAVGQVAANFKQYSDQLGGLTKEQLLQAQQSMMKFRKILLGFNLALIAGGIAYAVYKKRQENTLATSRRFIEITSVQEALTIKLAEATEKLEQAQSRANGGTSAAVEQAEAEVERLQEILTDVERTQVQTFFRAADFKLSDAEADELMDSYKDLFGALSKLSNDDLGIDFNAQIAEALSISEEDATALYDKGIGAFFEAVMVGEAAGNNSLQRVRQIFAEIRTEVGRGIDGQGFIAEDFPEEMKVLQKYAMQLADIQIAVGKNNMSEEVRIETLQRMVDAYNDANELTGQAAIKVDDLQKGTKLYNDVIQQEIQSLVGASEVTKDNSAAMQELADSFLDAAEQATNLIVELDKIDAIDIMSGDSIVAGFEKMNDRMIAGNFLMAEMTSKGFPAIAKAASEMAPGERIAYLTAQLQNSNSELQDMESYLISTKDGYQEFANVTDEGLQTIINSLTDGIEDETALKSLSNVFTEVSISQRAEELEILTQIVSMQKSSKAAAEAIADAQQKLASLTEDLVYQGYTISQIDIRRMEAKEAQLAFEEAIAEYGAEGVITSNEQLKLLQMTLNIDRMRDKLSQQMTAREAKRIRDKEKEVKFLELAVEQGVAEQLDLDAAKEELDELKNPLSDAERKILELQKEIAEAQKVSYEARIESVSPEVLDAMQNVVDKEKEMANFGNQVANAQTNVAEAFAAARIEADKNKAKLHELMIMYPNMQGMIKGLADSIGIPAEITQAVLVEMEKSRAAYESELSIMNTDYEAFIAEIATKPIVFTADTSQVDNAINRLTSTGRSQGIVNMFGDPDEYYGRVKEYSTAPLTATGRSQGIVNMFGDPDEYFGRYSGGIIPVGRYSTVGEAGPEKVMSLRGGGSMVFPNKTGGGGNGITVDNMNINITGLPADPITARKVALNIRKELTKLEKEGNAGTGLLNR